jgi:hypothetical protein
MTRKIELEGKDIIVMSIHTLCLAGKPGSEPWTVTGIYIGIALVAEKRTIQV